MSKPDIEAYKDLRPVEEWDADEDLVCKAYADGTVIAYRADDEKWFVSVPVSVLDEGESHV